MPPRTPLRFADVLALCATLPGIEESTSYGTPSIKVKGKMLVRLKEDGETIVLRTPFVVRDHLLHTEPAVFFITDHYRDYPAVLVRLAAVRRAQLAELLEAAWREAATRKLVAAFDSDTAPPLKRSTATKPSAATKRRPAAKPAPPR